MIHSSSTCSIHDAQEGPGLQGDTPGVDVLDQLPEDVRLELLYDHGLVLLHRRLRELS